MAKQKRSGFGSVRTLASGRVQARYSGPDGLTHKAPQTFDTKGDAETFLATVRADIVRQTWRAPETSNVRFAEYTRAWIDGRDVKPTTRETYQRLLTKWLVPTFGTALVRTITPDAVRRWHADAGAAKPTARARAYQLLHAVLATAVDDGILQANPARIRGATNTRRVHKIEPLSVDELAALVAVMPEQYRLMTMLAAWTALRFGELTELRRADVDLRSGVLKVRRAVVRVRGEFVIGSPKSRAGIRDVHVPPHLVPSLKAHLPDDITGGRDALLFPARDGGHLAPTTVHKVLARARAQIGRPDLRWHDLRHTGAVLAASTGASLADLMARLGHSTVNAALIYQHSAQGRDAEIARKLSELAAPSR